MIGENILPQPIREFLHQITDLPPCSEYAADHGWEDHDNHFFPDEMVATENVALVDEIRGLCVEECPVRMKCLEAGLANTITLEAGVWGGTTRVERAKIRRGELTVAQVDEGWRRRMRESF